MTANPNLDLRGLTGAQGKAGRDRPIAAGLASARPAANLITPDSFYYATDTGVLSYSNGTAWTNVSPGSAALGAWQTYTPVWTASVTNPTLGNGTISGRYQQIGKTVQVVCRLVIGSTTTLGSGYWIFSLPVPGAATICHGGGMASDAGVATYPILTRWDGGTFTCWQTDVANTLISPGAPFAWGASDTLEFGLTYEAA